MKSLLVFVLIILTIITLIPSAVQAQWTDNAKEVKLVNGSFFSFYTVTDSVENDTSKTFTLDKYDIDSLNGYALKYWLKHSSTAGVSAMKIYLEGAFTTAKTGNWFSVLTVLGASAVDSGETAIYGTTYLNGLKFPYYRIVFDGQPGNRSDCINQLGLYAYKRE